MSTTVDSKVVEMKFDNQQFERNVQTSINTINNLKKNLDLSGAAKGLDNVNTAARKLDFSGINSGVDTIKAKFSALEVMAVTALANITNSAVNAGKKLVSSFTTEPIKTGFEEYETQINAVQTILANTESKGSTLKDVNSALDELNHYADKTIYNFTEMTRNIGTFTAAGVDLDTSVSAIKGIANLAAVSGSNSQQASTAMYQLSQALASGTVKLQDWNSVVNAGMGGQVFQDALKETARVHGVKIDEMIKKEGSFRETLKNGWLTSSILTETLSKFTGDLSEKQLKSMGYTKDQIKEIQKMGKTANDAATKVKTFTQLMDTLKEAAQSGWSQTWEILIGDFEEAKKLWTSASDYFSEAINKSAEARNNLLEGWTKGGGREMAIEAITNAFKGLIGVIKPIKEAFREVFPKTTSRQLLDITRNIRDITRHFKLSSTQTEHLKSTFKGLFSIVDIGVTFLKELASGIVRLISNFTGLGDGVLGVTGSIGDWLSGVRDSVKETDLFGKAIDGLVNFLQNGIDKFKQFTSFIAEKIHMPGFEDFLKLMQGIWDIIQKVGTKVSKIGASIGTVIAGAFRSGDINQALDLVNGGILTGIFLGIKKFVNGLTEVFDDGGFLDNIKEILNGVKDSLVAWQQQLKAGALLKIAGAIALLTASLAVMALIDPKRLTNALGAITVLFGNLMGSLKLFDKMGGAFKSATKASVLMIGMSIAILILASALRKVAELSWSEIGKGLTGLVGLTAILVAAAKVMSSKEKVIVKGAGQMILMAAALKIMASVLKDMSGLSWESLGKGLAGVAGVLLTFVGFQKLMTMIDPKKMLKSSTSLLIMGAAMQIFASVCQKFGSMSWEGLGKSGVAIAGILALASGFALLAGLSSKMVKSSIALVIIGASMEIFADVCSKFESISWEGLGKSGVAIAGILALAAGFALLAGLSSGMMKSVVSLTIMSGAMEIFADVCQKFGSMEWEALGKAGVAIAGILALATGFSLLAGLSSGMMKSSVALLVMAAALRVFVPVMTTLGGMSWESIGKGLLTIAGAFAIMGIAGAVLTPVIPAILGLAGALALIGVATLTIGAGLLAASAGLTALSTITAATATAIVASLTIIITGIINLIPAIAQKIGEAIIVLCNVITQGIPAIGNAIRAIVVTVVKVLVECVPLIVEGALVLVASVLESLANHTQEIVGSIMQILIGIINGIAENLPALIQAVVNLVASFFKGLANALGSIDADGMLKGITCLGMLTGLMIMLSALAGLVPTAMVGVLALGVLIAELSVVLAAVGGLAQIPGLQWLISEGGNLLQAIGTAIGQFIGGIVGGVAAGVTSALPQVGTNLAQFMTNITPFIEGAKTITPESLSGVKSLVGIIIALTATNILDGIATFLTGESSLEKFSRQIVPFGKAIAEFSSIVSGHIDNGAVTAAANAGKVIAEMADTIPNSGGVVGFFTGENDLADFAKQLVPFGKAMAEFSSIVSGNIDTGAVTASANAGKAIAEMADTIPNSGGVSSWFTGENDLTDFAKQLVPFGETMAEFSSVVSGNIDGGAVTAAANAGKAISEMSDTLPNHGGMGDWFTGDNDLTTFCKQIIPFGEAMAEFSSVVSGNIDEGAVTAAANAGKAISEMSDTLPNHGGVASWFAGDNDYLGSFCDNIASFGEAMAEFSAAVSGNIDEGAVTAAANAGKAIAEMSATLPNSGGVAGWFSGDVDFEDFTENIVSFGDAMSEFSEKVKSIRPEAVKAAADAGKTLVNMVKDLPDDGNLSTAFENLATSFPTNLSSLGEGIASFSNAVANKNIDNKNVKAASDALTTITTIFKKENSSLFSTEFQGETLKKNLSSVGDGVAGFCSKLSTEGIDTEKAKTAADIIKTVTGTFTNNKISKFMEADIDFVAFSTKLSQLGAAVASFSKSVSGKKTDTESINKVIDVLGNLPDMNKISNFVSSGVDFNAFGKKLKSMGKAIRDFAKSVSGKKIDIEPANKAASTIGNVIDNLPDKEKVSSFIDSGINYGDFGNKLVKMGKAIVKFSNVFVDKKVNLDPAKNAIGVLNNLMNNLPDTKKIVEFTNSDAEYGKFGNKLTSMGKAMVKFSNSVSGKKFDSKSATSAITLSKKIMKNLPSTDKVNSFANSDAKFGAFGNKLVDLGKAMVKFSNSVAGKVKTADVNAAIKTCKSLVNMANGMGDANFGKLSSFSTGLKKLGSAQVDKFVSAFKNSSSKLNSAGATMAKNLDKGIKANLPAIKKSAKSASTSAIDGFKSKQTDAVKAGETLVKKFASGFSKAESTASKKAGTLAKKAVSGVRGEYDKFESAGSYLGKGLAKGLDAKRQSLYDKGALLAKSVNKGFTDNEEIHSPSKVWYGFGGYMVKGLTNALGDGEKDVNKSTSSIAKRSTKLLSSALGKITDMFDADVNTEPTIRPVLDLSEVESGAGAINGMLGVNPSVGVLSNIQSINSMMKNGQNGDRDSSLLTAIKGLRSDFASSNSGVTVDVHLDYNAGSDANEIATDIATSLRRALRRGI